jgi:hypothetical protein
LESDSEEIRKPEVNKLIVSDYKNTLSGYSWEQSIEISQKNALAGYSWVSAQIEKKDKKNEEIKFNSYRWGENSTNKNISTQNTNSYEVGNLSTQTSNNNNNNKNNNNSYQWGFEGENQKGKNPEKGGDMAGRSRYTEISGNVPNPPDVPISQPYYCFYSLIFNLFSGKKSKYPSRKKTGMKFSRIFSRCQQIHPSKLYYRLPGWKHLYLYVHFLRFFFFEALTNFSMNFLMLRAQFLA